MDGKMPFELNKVENYNIIIKINHHLKCCMRICVSVTISFHLRSHLT